MRRATRSSLKGARYIGMGRRARDRNSLVRHIHRRPGRGLVQALLDTLGGGHKGRFCYDTVHLAEEGMSATRMWGGLRNVKGWWGGIFNITAEVAKNARTWTKLEGRAPIADSQSRAPSLPLPFSLYSGVIHRQAPDGGFGGYSNR
jgi:hypothetical protein